MFPFMKFKFISLTLSTIALVGTLYYTLQVLPGFNQGIDFAGGIKIEIQNDKVVNLDSLRNLFEKKNINAVVQVAGKATLDLLKIEVGAQEEQRLERMARALEEKVTGRKRAIKDQDGKVKALAPLTEAQNKELNQMAGLLIKPDEKKKKGVKLDEFSFNSVGYLRLLLVDGLARGGADQIKFSSVNQVGPSIGEYLYESALNLLLVALALIIVYVAFRFKINFAVGAMLALLHDLFLTLGFIGILQIPLSIPVVAALLTILGYSINDTIVVFDRIRENDTGHEQIGFERIVDRSINESLTRTIITSITTLVAIGSVYLLGGEGLRDMAEVLILGIFIGTYSSSFIASPVVVLSNRFFRSSAA